MRNLLLLALVATFVASRGEAATRGRGESGSRLQASRLSSSADTTCAVRDDGIVHCWGYNLSGNAGNGTYTNPISTPVQPTGITGLVAVAAGWFHTCALLAFPGTVKCWGSRGEGGSLGDHGVAGTSSTPVNVNALDQVVAIGAGLSHSCALRADATVRCWGSSTVGQVGSGSFSTFNPDPVAVSGLTDAIAITVGRSHTCALRVAGTVSCWGFNVRGQLGIGNYSSQASPVSITGLSGVVQISAGHFHTCALLVDGTAKCWGFNEQGQLGDGTTTQRNVPTTVSQLSQAIAISAGGSHTCAIRADGGVRCWGLNTSGQLGDGTNNQSLTAATAVAGVNSAIEIATGNEHTCLVDASGAFRCWGANNRSQFGNGGTNASSVPVTVTGLANTIGGRGLASGLGFTCARRGSGAVGCWGVDEFGALGNGTPLANSTSPATVSGLNDAVALTAGDDHACALRATGALQCWGLNNAGQLGNGNTNTQPAPVSVSGVSNVVAVAGGSRHTCALLSDGTARCWGSNSDGQLGNNSFNSSLMPVTVTGLSNGNAIVAGRAHTCALLTDGTIRCWGSNESGQLGNGNNSDSPVPVTVSGLNNAVALSAGRAHTCAALATGALRCWGENGLGQLGNSSHQDRNLPDFVSGLNDVVAVSAGGDHTCAVRANSGADCWGSNSDGQLAAADTANHNTPTAVIQSFATSHNIPIRLSVVALAAGSAGTGVAHTCALQANGQPRCWGDNSQGQIGNGTNMDAARPTPVPSFTANVDPAITLRSNGRIAEVTALLNCEPGSHGQVFVSLAQGLVTGYGAASMNCTGGLLRIPVIVPAHGSSGFERGAATAKLEAIVRDTGQVTQRLFWSRSVVLSLP